MSEKCKPVVLVIRDGWGENHDRSQDRYNAVRIANTPVSDRLTKNWPRTEIMACGPDVGLPDNIMGNSEVGHQNIGAGRVVDQELVRIDKGIRTGAIKDSADMQAAFQRATTNNGALHLMGLVSDAGVHGMLEHLYGLVKLAQTAGVARVFVHAFTDGRDTGPFSGLEFISQVEAQLKCIGLGQIASVCGRYWSMDRDNRWDRVRKAYDCLTGRAVACTAASAIAAVQHYYDKPTTEGTKGDEFIVPTQIVDAHGQAIGNIKDGDSVIFFNFRGDRPRELTRAFIEDGFDAFDRGPKLDLFYATMTEYQKGLCPNILFRKPPKMINILGDYLAQKGITQLRCAETEKFPHVTFFFNDYREEPFDGEERIMIPSPQDVATYDEKPEMSAYGIRDAVVEAIHSKRFGLIVVNFANPDMVGHTGVLEAAVKACEVVDECVGDVLAAVDAVSGRALVTADHGNSDQLWDELNNGPHTAHTLNPVEVVIYGDACKDFKMAERGRLGDIAPTLLKLMDLPQPIEMTGNCLILE
jgi:2,3-bisphosphoglycerate-independent phosphoglycerate mutase